MKYRFEKTQPFNKFSTLYNVYYDNEPITLLVFGYDHLINKYYYCEAGDGLSDGRYGRVEKRCNFAPNFISVFVDFIDEILPLLNKEDIISDDLLYSQYAYSMPEMTLENIYIYHSTCAGQGSSFLFNDTVIDELYKDMLVDIAYFEVIVDGSCKHYLKDDYKEAIEESDDEWIDGVLLYPQFYETHWRTYFN